MSHIDEVHAATATAASVKGNHRTAHMNSDDNNNSSSSSYNNNNNNNNNSFYNNDSDNTDGFNQYQQYQQPYAYNNYQYPVDYHGGVGGVGYDQQQQVAYYSSNTTAAHYEMIAQNDSAGPQYYTGGGPEIDYSSMYYNAEPNGVPLVQQQMDMMSIYEEQQRRQQERESLLDDFLYQHPMRNHVLRNKQRRKAELLEEVKQRINEAKKGSSSSSSSSGGGGGGNSDQEKGEEHKIENVSVQEQTKAKPLFPEIKNSWASVIKKSADTIATTSTTSGKSGSTVVSAAEIKSERTQDPVQEKKTKTPVKQQQQQAEEKPKSSGTWASMAKGDQEKGQEREQGQKEKTKEEDRDAVNNTKINNGSQQQPQQQTEQQKQSEQQQPEEDHGNQISTPTKEPKDSVSAKNDIDDKNKRSADPEVRERAERYMKEAMRMYEKALNPFSLPQTHEIVCTWDPMTISMWLHHYVIAPSQYQKVFVGMDCEWDILKPNIDITLTQDHLYERQDRSEDDNNSESTSQKQPRRNTGTYTGFVHAEFPDIIQISTHHSTLIYQTLGGEMHPVPELITFLSSPLIMKLCCNYSYDVRLINAWIRKHNVAAPKFDNESLLGMYGFVDIDKQGNGAPYLCSTLLERELIKDWEVVFSRWSRMYLDDDQQQYAAIDAYLNLCLYEKMNDSVKKRHSTRGGYYHNRGNMPGFTREPREGSSSYRRHEYANNNSSGSNRSGDKRVNRNFQRRRNRGGLRHGQQGADQL